jgi:large subunit ribosomal protein L35
MLRLALAAARSLLQHRPSLLTARRTLASPQKPTKYKMKTHSGAKKRFRVLKSGLVKRTRSGTHHKARYESGNKQRRSRKQAYLKGKYAVKIKRMLLMA